MTAMRGAVAAASVCVLACSLELPAEESRGDAQAPGSGATGGAGGAAGAAPGPGGAAGTGGAAGAGGVDDWCPSVVPTPLLCADFNAGSLQGPFGGAGVNGGDFVPDVTHYTSAPRSVRFSGQEGFTAYFREAVHTSYGHFQFGLDLRIEALGGPARVHVVVLEIAASVVTVFIEGATLGLRESPGQEWLLTTTLAPQTWHRVEAELDLSTGMGEATFDGGSPVSTPLSLTGAQQLNDFWIGFPYPLPQGSWAVQMDNVLLDAY
jgi:hypothetical protein